MRRAYPKADAIVAVSDGVADDLARSSRLERTAITRIYNPVVSARLDALAAEPLDHPWFAPAAPPVILGVGRLTAAKDFGTLIRAFAELRRRRRVRLLILGEGEERAPLDGPGAGTAGARRRGPAGFRRQPVPVHEARRRIRAVVALGRPRQRPGGSHGLRRAGRQHGLPERSARDPRRRPSRPAGAGGRCLGARDAPSTASLAGPASPTAVARAQAFSVEAALDRYAAVLGI